MACPTCDHTMQKLGETEHPTWWCPRCGTLKGERHVMGKTHVVVEAPKLVERGRSLVRSVTDRGLLSYLHALGVLEALFPPTERPKV